MALLTMCTYDPPGESRHRLLYDCLASLDRTVNPARHRLVVVCNGPPSPQTQNILTGLFGTATVIYNPINEGTARGINKGWKLRKPGEHAVKLDSDIILQQPGWADAMEDCLNRDPLLGIIGLKRRDCLESPNNPAGSWCSSLHMLPHVPGEKWYTVERVDHVMGTCQMYSDALLQKIGYLIQPGLYGYDDCLSAIRCRAAGFYSAFLCNYDVDHPDPGDTPHQTWKTGVSGAVTAAYNAAAAQYIKGERSVYQGPDDDL